MLSQMAKLHSLLCVSSIPVCVCVCVCGVVCCVSGHRNSVVEGSWKTRGKAYSSVKECFLCKKGTRRNQQTPPKLCGCGSQLTGHALLFPGGKQTPPKDKLLASLHWPKRIKDLPPPSNVKCVLRPMALRSCHMKWITKAQRGGGVPLGASAAEPSCLDILGAPGPAGHDPKALLFPRLCKHHLIAW